MNIVRALSAAVCAGFVVIGFSALAAGVDTYLAPVEWPVEAVYQRRYVAAIEELERLERIYIRDNYIEGRLP